jgi:hypothetical protein
VAAAGRYRFSTRPNSSSRRIQWRSAAGWSYGGVGLRPAVLRADVELRRVADVGVGQRPGQPAHLLRIHRPVVVGMADVQLPGGPNRRQVRAVRAVGGEIATMEAGGCRHRVGALACHAQAQAPAQAVSDGADRPAGDRCVAAQECQPRLRVAVRGLRGHRLHLGAEHRPQRPAVLRSDELLDVLGHR